MLRLTHQNTKPTFPISLSKCNLLKENKKIYAELSDQANDKNTETHKLLS